MSTEDDRKPNPESTGEPTRDGGGAVPWLVLAAVLLLFANGRHTVAAAAWLAPVFLLRFTRSRSPRSGLLVAWIVLAATWAFQLRGMAPLPGILYYVLAGVFGLVGTFPYAADRWLAPRIGGFRSTLVLPCAWVATEYLTTLFTPYGSWGSFAYTQHEDLAFIQIVSVTGIYGISFLIAWFAAVANWAWEHDFSVATVGRGALAYAALIAIVLFGGGMRLVLFAPASETVRVASLTRPDIDLFGTQEAAQRARAGTATDEDLDLIRTFGDSINSDLLARTEREARAGAKIVFWGEGNGFAFKADEAALIHRSADVARRNGIYLGLGMVAWNMENPKPMENKLVLIDPRGDVVWEYWKAIPVPGQEAATMATDDGRIKSVKTPHGTVAAAICYDMDFPGLLSQAGDLGADLLIVPSNDWKEIDPWHSHMARFRAIEQGFNMVRHVSGGLSIATDYQGRVLAAMDHFTTSDRNMISHVPTRGVWTIYSTIGDTFAWLCFVGLIFLVVAAVRTKTEPRV